jgi:hypothetical protein
MEQSRQSQRQRLYVRWLRSALFDLVGANLGSLVLGRHVIAVRDMVSETLVDVYEEAVPSRNKRAFRSALGSVVLEDANRPTLPYTAYQEVLMTVGPIGAVESFEALVSAIGSMALGEIYPALVRDLTNTINRLVGSWQAASDALTRLIYAPNFRDGDDLLLALLVLVRLNPAGFSSVLVGVAARIGNLPQLAEGQASTQMVVWSTRLLEELPLTAIAESVRELARHGRGQVAEVILSSSLSPRLIWDDASTDRYWLVTGNRQPESVQQSVAIDLASEPEETFRTVQSELDRLVGVSIVRGWEHGRQQKPTDHAAPEEHLMTDVVDQGALAIAA